MNADTPDRSASVPDTPTWVIDLLNRFEDAWQENA
jgi:hypothetical protein